MGGEADMEQSWKASFHAETQVPAGYPLQSVGPVEPTELWAG